MNAGAVETSGAMTHEAARLALPWYVNATLDGTDRAAFEAHLAVCADCRHEVALERRLAEALSALSSEDDVAEAARARVFAAIDADCAMEAGGPVGREGAEASRRGRPMARRVLRIRGARRSMLAAGVAAGLATVVWLVPAVPPTAVSPDFTTLTTPEAEAGALLRVKLDTPLDGAGAEAFAGRHGFDLVAADPAIGLITLRTERLDPARLAALHAEPGVVLVVVGSAP